jgi:hypothetical protein
MAGHNHGKLMCFPDGRHCTLIGFPGGFSPSPIGSFAGRTFAQGVDLQTIKDLLGHSSIGATSAIGGDPDHAGDHDLLMSSCLAEKVNYLINASCVGQFDRAM